MEIHLRPELEAMVRQAVDRGLYQNADEFVERAVAMLHQQEAWLADHRDEVESKIAAGYESAQRGEVIAAEDVHARMDDLKRKHID